MKYGVVHTVLVILLITLTAGGCTTPSSQRYSGSPPRVSPQYSLLQEHPVSPDNTGTGIPLGRGEFVFSDPLGNADRPVTVYTYRPLKWNRTGPVLIVIPGAGRDGRSARFTWIRYAEQYSSLLIIPEFSLEYYPSDDWYHLGNTYNSTNLKPKANWTYTDYWYHLGNTSVNRTPEENRTFSEDSYNPRNTFLDWNPKANWTYVAIEHLFDYTREKSGLTQTSYLLFGHSAGAQFVHRMVTHLPEARYRCAVAANSGIYLLPEYSDPYPFGLKDSPVDENSLPIAFARKLIIMSGGSDTDPDAGDLANFPEAEAQGSTRFERARFYFTTARSEAARLSVPLNWEYHVVPGIGHDAAGMAGPSAEILFNDPHCSPGPAPALTKPSPDSDHLSGGTYLSSYELKNGL